MINLFIIYFGYFPQEGKEFRDMVASPETPSWRWRFWYIPSAHLGPFRGVSLSGVQHCPEYVCALEPLSCVLLLFLTTRLVRIGTRE